MVTENGEGVAKGFVECLHCREQSWPLRDPRLSGAWRNCNSNSETLLQREPWCESAHQRRAALAEVRKDLFAWLDRKGYAYIPSEANMVLIDSKRPGRETAQAMLEHKVAIGRSWPSLPTHVRVTIGTAAEMEKFKAAFERVVRA